MSLVKTLYALVIASGASAYYLQVEAPGTDVDKLYVAAHEGIQHKDGLDTSLFSAFSFTSDQSKAFANFHQVQEYHFGPANAPIGLDWYLISTGGAAITVEKDEDDNLESYVKFYACQNPGSPSELGGGYAWYGSVDPSSIPSSSIDEISSPGISPSPEISTSIDPSVSPSPGISSPIDDISSPIDPNVSPSPEISPPIGTDVSPSPEIPPILSEISSPLEPVSPSPIGPEVSPLPEISSPVVEPAVSPVELIAAPVSPVTIIDEFPAITSDPTIENLVVLDKRDFLKPLTTSAPYPVDFATCVPIVLKAVTTATCENCTSPVVSPPSCTGTACCRTICTTSCVASGTGCAAPVCSTLCPSNPNPVQPPSVTPDKPCPTCTPIPCSKCQDPNVWEIPGCPTCVRTVTNFVYTCPSLTTITVQTCPTVNKCGTKVITAPPGQLTISGLAIIEAKEAYTTTLLTSKPTATGTGKSTSKALGTGSSLTGGSGGSTPLVNLLVGILSALSFMW